MLELRTSQALVAGRGLPAMPGLPADAIGMSDFLAGLHVTQATASTIATSTLVMDPKQLSAGYAYGRADVIDVPANWTAVEYDGDGSPLGLRLNGSGTQLLTAAHRQDMSGGSLVGATAVAESAAQPYQRWTLITPTGTGEASVTLSTASVAAGKWVLAAVDLSGSGIVQLGFRAAPGLFVNVNLAQGIVSAAGGAMAAITRRGRGWTLGVRFQTTAAVADLQPYVASVAAIGATDTALSGQPFRARLMRAIIPVGALPSGAAYPPPAPSVTSASISSSYVVMSSSLLADTAPFTSLFRFVADWTPGRGSAGMFALKIGSAGIELRTDSKQTLIVYDRTANAVLHSFGRPIIPDAVYRVGVSRAADGTVAFAVNGDMAKVMVPAAASGAPRWGAGLASETFWGGHLQRVILYDHAKGMSELPGLCERWL